jgi:hypothetical protein
LFLAFSFLAFSFLTFGPWTFLLVVLEVLVYLDSRSRSVASEYLASCGLWLGVFRGCFRKRVYVVGKDIFFKRARWGVG